MPRWDVIVVGAGLGGLLTGAILARRGRRVLVLEREAQAGGRLRSDHVDGFVVDCGAFLWPNKFLDQALAAAGVTDFIGSEIPANEVMRIYIQGHGGKRFAFPWVGRAAGAVDDTIREVYRLTPDQFHGLAAVLGQLAQLDQAQVTALLRVTVGQWLASNVTDNTLNAAVLRTLMLFGTYDPASASIGEFARTLQRNRGGGTPAKPEYCGANPIGGVRALVEAIRTALQRNGGELRLATPVDQIIVEQGRATGVLVQGTEPFQSRALPEKRPRPGRSPANEFAGNKGAKSPFGNSNDLQQPAQAGFEPLLRAVSTAGQPAEPFQAKPQSRLEATAVVSNLSIWTLFDIIAAHHFPAQFVANAKHYARVGGTVDVAYAFTGLPTLRDSGEPDRFPGWTRLLVGPDRSFGGGLFWTSHHSPRNAPAGKHILQGMRLVPQSVLADNAQVDRIHADFDGMLREIYRDADQLLLWRRQWITQDGTEYMISAVPRPAVQAPTVAGLYFVGETIDVPAIQMDAAACSALECARLIDEIGAMRIT